MRKLSIEEKELLLKDLSARLPYHILLKVWLKDGTTEEGIFDIEHNYGDVLRDAFYYNEIIDIKPYLRPMSSMTKEEKKKYTSLGSVPMCIDWLLENNFDYRGLIPMGLAIEVTKENNSYKK